MSVLQIGAASVGFGFGRVAFVDYYRKYKPRRSLLPAGVRNAGFWTDRKLKVAEIAVWTFLIGPPLMGFALLRGMS
jgi:hypothetical protein